MSSKKHDNDGFEPLPTSRKAQKIGFGAEIWLSWKDLTEEGPDSTDVEVLSLQDHEKLPRQQMLEVNDIEEFLHDPHYSAILM